MKKRLSIDYNYIDEGCSYSVSFHNGVMPYVKINKSAFDNIDKKYTKKRNGRIFLACPQSVKGLLNFLPVQFVYKRIVTKDAISFIS
tara:strand:- start:677 stop:937 length:261 start_codon:yes stop_codon:yes gene_type:complete